MNTCLLIKTLDRPTALERLLRSLRHSYPEAAVLVADDSEDQAQALRLCAEFRADFFPLAPDVGLSAGRNRLFDEAQAQGWDVAVLLDDDFVFTPATRVEKLVGYVRGGICDVAAGTVLQQGRESHYEGTMTLTGGMLTLKALRSKGAPIAVDIAYNFFAASVPTVCRVRWDEALKICEHQAFFLRLQAAGAKVVYDPGVEVDHYPERNQRYGQWRNARANQYYKLFKSLYQIDLVVGHL